MEVQLQILQHKTLEEMAAYSSAAAAMLQDETTILRLNSYRAHDTDLCRNVLQLCLPWLELQEDQTAEQWLQELYTKLSDNLFPDDDSGHPRCALDAAQELYLAALESVLVRPCDCFDPLSDLYGLDPELSRNSRTEKEYRRFVEAARASHFVTLMRLGRELQPFDPASHTIGVHNVALQTATLAARAGLKVDLKLVSAASLGHDIGKFGCRGEDAKRIPYLHYYYTWQWFSENNMEQIGHVSANHSTWDLEFENLPIESLLLIYADFRVRGTREAGQKERVAIYTLAQSYEMIFSKLYNMTPEKQKRYQTVYYKLQDFERYLRKQGVSSEMGCETLLPTEHLDASLHTEEQALRELQHMTFENNIRLMHTISVDESFAQLLEQAKTEKNLHRIRTYLGLFEEYSTYMTKSNKRKTLAFLYELLMHQDGDVRRTAGYIMGQILANSGPKYRKERPQASNKDVVPPTMMALLDESVQLWSRYIERCLHPGLKVSAKHALRIGNSLKDLCQTMFRSCEEKEAQIMLRPLLNRLYNAQKTERFSLVDALYYVPSQLIPPEDRVCVVDTMGAMLGTTYVPLQMVALRYLERLATELPELRERICSHVRGAQIKESESTSAAEFMRSRILGDGAPRVSAEQVTGIYLSNLKNAVHWTVKLVQIDMLCAYAQQNASGVFHTAMHLSNLLSVSEHLPVREYAGESLLKVARWLSVDQINEITVDLVRELENGQEQISRYIPPYVGRLMCMLPDKELHEAMDSLRAMVHSMSIRAARAALYTLGVLLNTLSNAQESLADEVLGLLMTGICHYEKTIHQTALSVLCRDVFGSEHISEERKHAYFVRLNKKLLTILSEPRDGKLTFFNRAAMLNHLYRFIIHHEVEYGDFRFPEALPVAFFPGTFDPFSVGHKRIVQEIGKLGFEVYLAIDEFSWSKNTLAKLQRRQIAGMSIADLWDTYLFPDDIPVNIAMPADLAMLKSLFGGKELYLVAGSDVIRNASAYRFHAAGSAAEYNHVVFCRDSVEGQNKAPLEQIIRGKLQKLTLPEFFDNVSSTRIREYVDKNLDISMLVDPVVQNYIYEYGLYVHSPEMKNEVAPQSLFFRRYRSGSLDAPAALNHALCRTNEPLGVTLNAKPDTMIGWTIGHTVTIGNLYDALQSLDAAMYVRRHASGRILMVDRVFVDSDVVSDRNLHRMLLNELLARSLEQEHTYAVCRCEPQMTVLLDSLQQLGFVQVPNQPDLYYVDMRAPVVLLQDVMLRIKKPHHDNPKVKRVVNQSRPKLRKAITEMFPGKLVLCFDSEMLNQALMDRIQKFNGVDKVPTGVRSLGPYMCVPYGKILSDEIVPNTVTKTLHVEKAFRPDMRGFDIIEYPGHSPLQTQVRTLKSFRRPVILVDDLLHKGYRMEKLDEIFREENLKISKMFAAIMSGDGQDLMKVQNRKVDCEYFIPNLHYWITESLQYPFIGGDSIEGRKRQEQLLPSINLILPYIYPTFLADATDEGVRSLSRVSLENARDILKVLEHQHQKSFNTALTIRRLGEAVQRPRLPDKGKCMQYDLNLSASSYLEDDLEQLRRMFRRKVARHEV